MSRYDNCSREELLRRIEELEAQLDTPKGSGSRFRERYACKILDSIPDMLTVLDRDGTLVELVSADETNHVGVPGGELAGQNIRTMLSPAACRNVKNNLDNVFATGCGSSSHHDITLDGRTRNYENRIFPLDGEHALCICRDITEAEAAKHELEMVKYALSFYNASPIFLKTYVHLQHQSCIFRLEMGFFHQASPQKKSAEPHARRIKFFQELFFIKLFFELFLLLLHKLHKFLQGS